MKVSKQLKRLSLCRQQARQVGLGPATELLCLCRERCPHLEASKHNSKRTFVTQFLGGNRAKTACVSEIVLLVFCCASCEGEEDSQQCQQHAKQ